MKTAISELNYDEARERVERGAKWLDTVLPNWFQGIDANILEMSRADRCICGQLGETLERAVGIDPEVQNGFPYYEFVERQGDSWSRMHGFSIELGELDFDGQVWIVLERCWIEQINKRK